MTQDTQEQLEIDAARWRALMSSPRLHWMGCAGFEFKPKEGADPESKALEDRVAVPRPDEGMHFGMEFWSDARVRDARFPDTFERAFMVTYVDELRARNAKAHISATGPLDGNVDFAPPTALLDTAENGPGEEKP